MPNRIRRHVQAWLLIFTAFPIATVIGQTGSENEPVRYIGGVTIDPNVHEGRLRPPVGVHSHQTLRVNRTHPEHVGGHNWTYSHASNPAYWNHTFYQQYLSNPVDEHIAPGQTLLTTSKDGIAWNAPVVGDLADDFESLPTGGRVDNWNIYAPIWAPIRVGEHFGNRYLQLEDKDPYDYARAVRVFPEGTSVNLQFRIHAEQVGAGPFDIDVTDRCGNRAVRLRLDDDLQIKAVVDGNYKSVCCFEPNTWYEFQLEVDAQPYGSFTLSIDSKEVLADVELAVAVKSVERLSFRTGPYRDHPNRKTDNEKTIPPLPGADDPVERVVFRVDDVLLQR